MHFAKWLLGSYDFYPSGEYSAHRVPHAPISTLAVANIICSIGLIDVFI